MGKARRKRAARAATQHKSTPPRALVARARALIMSVLPALAIFLGTRQLLAEAYRIPSGSMEPTLLVGDWLFVNKLRLGPHVPFTNHSLPGMPSRNVAMSSSLSRRRKSFRSGSRRTRSPRRS
jgi:signal peptidase I